ncbi:hypothetical protein O1R50_04040 [Glycomyces luteolus]|uniref:Uncharacterized protein n=1 Tax=Glycomyces luteolus TaxID=2670330 RepID=A0A9X3P8D1_9ACTN|nr:hypothetical protein [Glycomyces luteolus]MDA1358778.1 hypothetical protein [Glycomyces luteolus]
MVEATAQGFRYDLVVADAEAARNPDLEAIAFAVEAAGVEVAETATGEVEVKVAGQAEMASGEALMWEAPSSHDGTETVPDLTAITDTPADPDQEVAPVDVTLESDDLVLRPDLELLRGADTRYPVVIDPQWNGGIQDNLWGLVNTKYPDSVFYRGKNTSGDYFMSNTSTWGNAGAGQTCDSWSGLDCYSSTYDMRSMFRMDTDTITQNAYKIPNKGLFKIVQRHSASCSNGTARVYRTGGYNSNDTWDTQPAWHESVTISNANNGATCDGSAYVSFNVTSMVKMADDNEWANLTLGLRAPDESPSPELLEWNRFDSYTAVLEIYYDVMPYAVSNRKLNGVFCTTSVENAPWTNSRTPRMSALYRSQDTSLLYQARLRSSTPVDAIVYDYTSAAPLTANKEYGNTLPTKYALGDGLYYWLARSFSSTNSDLASAWSAPCRFKVDGTKPLTPTVTPASAAPYEVDGTLNLTLKSTDPTVNGFVSGIDHFEYSWQTNSYNKEVASTGTATITRTLSAGRHVLYVRSVDNAGNESEPRTYTFFVGRDILTTPMATWRFEGDTADDTGHRHNLALASGTSIAYTADRDGRANAALALDGSTCLTGTGSDHAHGRGLFAVGMGAHGRGRRGHRAADHAGERFALGLPSLVLGDRRPLVFLGVGREQELEQHRRGPDRRAWLVGAHPGGLRPGQERDPPLPRRQPGRGEDHQLHALERRQGLQPRMPDERRDAAVPRLGRDRPGRPLAGRVEPSPNQSRDDRPAHRERPGAVDFPQRRHRRLRSRTGLEYRRHYRRRRPVQPALRSDRTQRRDLPRIPRICRGH